MAKCAKCGGVLRRVHRTFFERFGYMAIYECRSCREEQVVLRRYRYHFGPHSRCPRCGTFRVTRLHQPDMIDRMIGGPLNFCERLVGHGKLYHCRFCRIQFYDRRAAAPAGPPAAEVSDPRPVNGSEPVSGGT